MAADWIKVGNDLHEKPEVVFMASRLGTNADEVVGKLTRVWRWFDQMSRDGHVDLVTLSFVDDLVRREGFAAAMAEAGWLVAEGAGLTVPQFTRHNGESSKKRAEATERKRLQRERDAADGHADDVTVSRGGRDKSVTRRNETRRNETKDSKQRSSPNGEAAPAKAKKPRKKPTGPHAEFIAWWCERFEAVKGTPYVVAGAKDGAAVSKIMKSTGDDLTEMKRRAERLLNPRHDEWLRDKASLAMLSAKWNDLGQATRGQIVLGQHEDYEGPL